MFKRLSEGLRRRSQAIVPSSDAALAKSTGVRVLYTQGDELISASDYRATFEQTIARSLGGQANVDDYTLARAVGVSATAYACTEYDANTTSGLPLVVQDPRGEPLAGTPLGYVVAQRGRLVAQIIRSLDIWGRCYLWKRPNPYGWMTGLEWVNPLCIRELTSAQMRVVGYEIRDEWGYLISAREPVDNVVYIEEFDSEPEGAGLSKFEVAWRFLGIELGMATHAASFFTNAARIDGMLTFDRDMSPEQLKIAKDNWKQFKGAANAHQTAVMPGGARWTPVQAVPRDLMMADLSDIEEKRIVSIWGMHRALLGLGDIADPLSANSTYGAQEVNFIRNTSLPRLKNVVLSALNEQWAWCDFDRPQFYTLAVDEPAIPQLAEAQLSKSQTSINLVEAGITDIDEGRSIVGYKARGSGEFLVRDPTLPRIALETGAITLAQYRQMILGSGGDDPSAAIVVIGGQVLPAGRLMEIATANANRLIAAPPPPEATPPDPTISISTPQTPPAQALAEGPTRAGVSLCIALDLANQPDLVALQRRVQDLYGDQPIAWNAPDSLHCTLLVAPMMDEAQVESLVRALWDVDVPDLDLKIGSLNSFDNVGEHAIHFRVRRNADLADLQQAVYDLVTGLGIQVSGYSVPPDYKPHVTMGKAQTKPKPVTYLGKTKVRTNNLIVWKDDDVVYSSAEEKADAAMGVISQRPDLADSLSESEPPATRSLTPMQVVIDLSENQFVKYARRTVSEALTAQNVLDAEWAAPVEWRIVLAEVGDWTPNAVAAFLRSADLSEARKLDLPTGGWAIQNHTLYLTLAANDALAAMRSSIVLDLEGAQLYADPTWTAGIAIATLPTADQVALDLLPVEPYPIVGANITVITGEAIQYQWPLRGASAVQVKELQSWRNLVRRKGRAYRFNVEALPRIVELYVRFALEDDDDEAVVFKTARALLIRSYDQTRDGYVQAVTDILTEALGDDGKRRTLATDMRKTARLFGLQAASDALEDAGVKAESLSEDDVTLYRAWLAETSDYITGLGEEIFQEQGLTAAMIPGRAQMWADKSLDDLYYAILRQNAPAKTATWRVDPTNEHCDTCAERDGETKTLDEWGQVGFPRDRRLDCGGWKCGCQLEDGNGNVLRSR